MVRPWQYCSKKVGGFRQKLPKVLTTFLLLKKASDKSFVQKIVVLPKTERKTAWHVELKATRGSAAQAEAYIRLCLGHCRFTIAKDHLDQGRSRAYHNEIRASTGRTTDDKGRYSCGWGRRTNFGPGCRIRRAQTASAWGYLYAEKLAMEPKTKPMQAR